MPKHQMTALLPYFPVSLIFQKPHKLRSSNLR